MRALQVVLFVVFLLVLATQSLRHVYVKWIEPRGSVLDRFRPAVAEDIAASRSLDELTDLYAKAHAAVKVYEEGRNPEEIHHARETRRAPYEEEAELRGAIERWEEHRRIRFQLWFYWGCGLLGVLAGLFVYARLNAWLGMVGMIAGFSEMAIWTSPLWRSWGPQAQFDRLLTLKLALSLVSLALLVSLWLWRERRTRGEGPP
jgi:hypothetical protein